MLEFYEGEMCSTQHGKYFQDVAAFCKMTENPSTTDQMPQRNGEESSSYEAVCYNTCTTLDFLQVKFQVLF